MKTFELGRPSQDVWGIDEWVLREHRVRRRALRAGSGGAARRALNREARRVMRAYTTSFFIVSRFLPRARREEVEAVYAAGVRGRGAGRALRHPLRPLRLHGRPTTADARRARRDGAGVDSAGRVRLGRGGTAATSHVGGDGVRGALDDGDRPRHRPARREPARLLEVGRRGATTASPSPTSPAGF